MKHLGSAHTEAALGLLMEQAHGLLDDGQDLLDLGIEPTPRVAALLPAPAAQRTLGPSPGAPSDSARGARRDGSARVVGTDSRLLFESLGSVYPALGFDVIGDRVFRDLVIARIVEPTSLLDSARVLTDLGRTPASYSTMKRTLNRTSPQPSSETSAESTAGTGAGAAPAGYRDQVAKACFDYAASNGDVSLCLYDVTTLYFETDKEDDLRKVGYSKERRVDPQVVVGLLVDRRGFPLEIGCFEGNTGETTTIIPIIKAFQQRHDLADMVVVADAGMLSASNLTALDEAGLRFIVGSRVTKAPADLESHFRWHADAFADGQVIDTITPKNRRGASKGVENDPNLKLEPSWDPTEHSASWGAVWAYSTKRAVRDNKTLTLQENRAREVVAGDKTAKTPRFVKNSNGTRSLDETSLARARRLVGLKGYVTNLDVATMPAAEVIASYHALWQVEQSFRMSKTDLRARPMFHHRRQAIEAHLTIVFTALAVSREAQNRTGLAIGNIVRQLRPLRSATIAVNGTRQTLGPAIAAHHQEILDALNGAEVTH